MTGRFAVAVTSVFLTCHTSGYREFSVDISGDRPPVYLGSRLRVPTTPRHTAGWAECRSDIDVIWYPGRVVFDAADSLEGVHCSWGSEPQIAATPPWQITLAVDIITKDICKASGVKTGTQWTDDYELITGIGKFTAKK